MLRIGVDARCLNHPFVRGMGRYLKNVNETISGFRDVEWKLFADRPDLPFHSPDCRSQTVNCFEVRGYRFHTWEQIGLPWKAKRARVDVLHCSATTLPWWQPVPTVVTVHDLIPWMDQWQEGNLSWYWRRLIPAALNRSAAIVTISHSAAKDITERWPHLADKLHVIPHGVEDVFRQISPEPLSDEMRKLGITGPYFLYVGGDIPRKRFAWARRVVSALGDSGVQLVACGLNAKAREELQDSQPGNSQIIACGYLPDAVMARLYQNAVAVLFPSLYEGFGFPVLESQAVGTPVLFSAVGSLEELVGPTACVLPPDDFEAWVTACRGFLNQRAKTAVPNQEARLWAQQFSWGTSAKKHLEVFERAARH